MSMDSTVQAAVAALASFAFITLVFAVLIFFCRGTKKRAAVPAAATATTRLPKAASRSLGLSSITVDESFSYDPSLSRIAMADIIDATNNFSPELIIGDGSFGLVYRAQLANGGQVAIKKLDHDAFQGFREFRAEMDTLGKLRHENIVKILGYCVSGADRLLIYEYVERGSLDQWLYDTSEVLYSSMSAPQQSLSWETRCKIVKGVANGLFYLHGLDTAIVHRDIKASNVLLDKEFEPHIADFGLARTIDSSHSHVSTQVAGTMGYMPPEYKEGLTVATVKVDVYSFGILMFEIATAKRPNWPLMFEGKEVGMVQWARKMVDRQREMVMLDPSIYSEGLNIANVKEFFRIACLCTSENAKERPLMGEVVDMLKQVLTETAMI